MIDYKKGYLTREEIKQIELEEKAKSKGRLRAFRKGLGNLGTTILGASKATATGFKKASEVVKKAEKTRKEYMIKKTKRDITLEQLRLKKARLRKARMQESETGFDLPKSPFSMNK